MRAMLIPVKRSLLFSVWLAMAGIGLAAPARAQAVSRLPPLPGSEPAGPVQTGADPQAPSPTGLTPQQIYEHIRRGVVAVERNGVPLAIGTVLDGDGRIL